jgi:hypothetical protein
VHDSKTQGSEYSGKDKHEAKQKEEQIDSYKKKQGKVVPLEDDIKKEPKKEDAVKPATPKKQDPHQEFMRDVKQLASDIGVTPKQEVKEPEKKTPARNCCVCGYALTEKQKIECYKKNTEDPVWICEDCEAKKPEPKEAEIVPANKSKTEPARIPMRSVTPQGSMIKGFVPSLKEIGKIKIGKKGAQKTGSGFRLPVKFDHFNEIS